MFITKESILSFLLILFLFLLLCVIILIRIAYCLGYDSGFYKGLMTVEDIDFHQPHKKKECVLEIGAIKKGCNNNIILEGKENDSV
jgi:hypothetical protein